MRRDVENSETSNLMSDELASVEHDANFVGLDSIELPAMESQSPRASVVARTGSQIMRRNSGRFESITLESVRRSGSLLRSSGSIKVARSSLLPAEVFCYLTRTSAHGAVSLGSQRRQPCSGESLCHAHHSVAT